MRDRFRTFDSRISFFAFADIITAVSGMLIFITLLLATDLGRPTDTRSQAANAEIDQQLQKTLSEQAAVDAQNRRLQELLAAADSAPDLEKLQADIARLRVQLADEQKKQSAIAEQMSDSQAARAARDQALGLTDLKTTVQSVVQEADALARQEAKAQNEMESLEQQVSRLQVQLSKLRELDGQLWLIPDRSTTTKEPILVTVAVSGATIDRFDHPEQRRELDKAGPVSDFKSYLGGAKAVDQYVVFYVRPSGIALFQDLLKSARDMGFEVGYDAVEENTPIHFSHPTPVDEPMSQTNSPIPAPPQKAAAVDGNSGAPGKATPVMTSPSVEKPQPAVPASAAARPKSKTWWQKLLALVGLG